MTQSPFYYDWQFWSAIAGLTALLLSQLPPIHFIFRPAKLRCDAFSRIHVTHKIGMPNAQWHLIIENIGGRALRVKAISLTFRRTGGAEFTLPAQDYFRTPEAKESVLLTPFRLEPGKEWAHVLNFYNMHSRDDDREYRRIASSIRTDIFRQKEEAEDKKRLCEAAPESIELAMAFFSIHFKWEPGEYELEIAIETDQPKSNTKRLYLFSMFESESIELRSYSDGYKYGAGVYWVSETQPGIFLPIRER